MKSFISVLMSVFTLFASLFAALTPVAAPKESKDDFVPVFRAVFASDTHVTVLGDKGCSRITKMMKQTYALADADADYNDVDVAVFSGDLTDSGTFTGFSAFVATTDAVLREGTERLAVVAQAHDCNTNGKDALNTFTELTEQETDIHSVIDGYHFIGLSTSSEDAHYTDAQIEWLDRELRAATLAAPLQPVFVFQHEHIKGTVYGSSEFDGWGTEYFNDVLTKYPQVINISGHSHYPANDPRSIWQGTYTAIGDGGLSYVELTVDDERKVHPDGYLNVAQALIVEIDSLNRVLVKVLDITAGKILCTYLIDDVISPVKLQYSHSERVLAAKAPVFADEAVLDARKGISKTTFTIPQAMVEPDNEVFVYRLTVFDADGNVLLTDKQLSEYYFADRPATITFRVQLPDGTQTVSVVAEDVWGNQSEPLTWTAK